MKFVLAAIARWLDNERFARWLRDPDAPNTSPKLLAIYQAIDDTDDTLQAVDKAIAERDYDEARRLVELGRASIKEHITELRELL